MDDELERQKGLEGLRLPSSSSVNGGHDSDSEYKDEDIEIGLTPNASSMMRKGGGVPASSSSTTLGRQDSGSHKIPKLVSNHSGGSLSRFGNAVTPKRGGILKDPNIPRGGSFLKKKGSGDQARLGRQGSFFSGLPKPLSRERSTMSSRLLSAPTKTVRFRLDAEHEKKNLFQLELFDPKGTFLRRWISLCIIVLSISFFRLPVIMAFGMEGIWIDIVVDVYFLLDNIIALNTSLVYKDRIIDDRRQIVWRYFSWETFKRGERWCFPVFVMEFIPFYVGVIFAQVFKLPDWFLTICAVPRARRIYDLLAYFHAQEVKLDSDLRVLAVTKYALVLFGSAHWFGCIWWAVARFSGFGETCWVEQYLHSIGTPITAEIFQSNGYNYLLSLYWGFTVLAGILFQGYAPDTTQETILSVISIFCQVLIFSFLLGILLHYIVKKDAHQEKFNHLMDKVERYSKMHELPRKLESSIKLCFTFQHQKRIGEDEEILATIPMTMRTRILAHRYQMVASNQLFADCLEHFVTSILAVLRPKILIPGVTIYNRDDMTREVIFLEEGEVEVYDAHEAEPYKLIRPTETTYPVAGAIAFFLGIPQPFTHKASNKSHVKLLTLSKEDYEDIKDRYPESRDQLIDNIKAQVGLGREGEAEAVAVEAAETPEEGPKKKDSKESDLRRKVALGLQKKLDDNLATMFNAIDESDLESVKLLVDKGFKPNAVDYDLRSGLHFAAAKGEDKIVEQLIQRGADVHLRDRWGRNALQDAIDAGHTNCTTLLAAQGAELKLHNAAGRLCAAAFSDNLFELQRLVENGINCNTGDYDGRTALHLGACEGNNKVVEYLLLPMNKCNPGALDRWGISPLFDAIKHGNAAVARILYENGARLSKGKAATFLCTAAAYGDVALLQMLNECGVETNIGDYDSRYPIHLAAAEGEVVSVEFLMYAHADISVRDRWGRTPLDDAIAGKHWMCAKVLLSFGADHSLELTDELRKTIADVDLKEVRRVVKKERDEQEHRKNVAKQLRDMVKWMATESDTWIKNIEERLKHLQRMTDRMITEDDAHELGIDACTFMDQSDLSILVSEHPERYSLPNTVATGSGGQSSYMLSRFFSEAALRGGEAANPYQRNGRSIKSMQHFFLQWNLIHAALKDWKDRLMKYAHSHHISKQALEKTFKSLNVQVAQPELDRAFSACRTERERQLSGAPATEGENTVTFVDIVTAMPVWSIIMRNPAREEGHLSKLQKAIDIICEGFRLLTGHGGSKLGKAAWVIQKHDTDMGEFANVIDQVFLDRDAIEKETFFLVVARWAALQEEGSTESQSHLSDLNSLEQDSVSEKAMSSRLTDSYNKYEFMMRGTSDDVVPLIETQAPSNPTLRDQDAKNQQKKCLSCTNPFTALWRNWLIYRVKEKLRKALARRAYVMPDFERHFSRLDVDMSGWLDKNRAELLLSWGMDAHLSREEWELVTEHLKDKTTGKVNLAAIEGLWIELSSKRRGLAGCLGLTNKRAKFHKGVQEKTLSEVLLFDGRGYFIALWNNLMILNALYYFLSVPFIISFLSRDILTRYQNTMYVAYAFDLLLVCNVFVKLNTTFTDSSCSVRVIDRKRIRARYLTSDFIVDAVALFPLDVIVRYLGGSGSLVAFTRLNKLIVCHRLYSFFRRRSLTSSSRLAADLQALLFSALGLIHVLTCIWYFMTADIPGNYQALSDYEGYGDYTNDPNGGGPFRLEYYIFCFMVVTQLIACQGIYELIMGRVDEVIFVMVILVLNLSTWAYLMGTISGLCVTADESIAQSHEMMSAVSRFIQHNPMPPGVSEELKSYFNINAQQKTQLSLTEQNEIYRNLPLSLQVEAARHISRDSLLSVEIFEKTSEYFLDSISTLLDMEIFGVGDFVYKADDICRSLFIIASGSVEMGKVNMDTNEFEVDDVVGPGTALGQLEFLFDVRYLTCARVAGSDDVRVFRLGKEDFTRVIKLYPMDEDILYENLSRLADDKIETQSRAHSMHTPSMSTASLESSLHSALGGDDMMEKAMDSIDKAKKRSKEQRIRSFCNAAAEGNMDILQRLLRSGIDVNGRDCNGRTALMVASCAGNVELVKWFVGLGAEINLRDKFGGSALLDAMNQGTPQHLEIMGYLNQRGAVLELDDAAGELCQAAADGNKFKLEGMLENNIDPDVADYDKRTPLHLAASEGHLDCVRLLIQYWANINPIDRMGGTPLTDAVRHGHIEVQRLLREHGGILNMDPVELGTCACEAGSSGDLQGIKVLVDNGADINQGDYDGRTALHLATCFNRLSVIEYLISLPNINVNPLDRLGSTPLDDAMREGLPAIASILKACGGVSGEDRILADKIEEKKEQKAHAHLAKVHRREEAVKMNEYWTSVQEELGEVYKYMSEFLPPMCKYLNLLSMTLRSRRTTSTIDRSPQPNLWETRIYFYNSFRQFLERRYKVNLESSLTLIEELKDAATFEEKARIGGQLIERFLDAKSADRVHFHPTQVAACRERYMACFQTQIFPDDLFEPFRVSVEEKIMSLLPEYFASDYYYHACRQPNGFLWRVIKLARLIYGLTNQMLKKVIDPFLALCDKDALSCVPHYSVQSRAAFRDEFVKLRGYITSLQPKLNVIAYKAKQDTMRESLKEKQRGRPSHHASKEKRIRNR